MGDRDEADASDDDMVVEDDVPHSLVEKSASTEQNENEKPEKPEEGEVKENDEPESESAKSDESSKNSEESSSKTEDSEAKMDDDGDPESTKKDKVENTIKKEETLKLVDGWTKSKKSRTPTPEPVNSDPKSAEDEAMDTDDHPENSKDGEPETETNKDSLLLDLPKQSNVKADEGKEGAEKCSDTEKTSEQNSNDKTKEEKLVGDAIAVKQPCILIFDSMQTGSRARVAATLREYL